MTIVRTDEMVRPELQNGGLGRRARNAPLADRGIAVVAAPNSGLLLQCQRRPAFPARRGARDLATDAGNKQDPSLQRCTEL